METCIITNKTFPDKDVAITVEGPVAIHLWKDEIQLKDGYAVPDNNVQKLFEKNCGRKMSLNP